MARKAAAPRSTMIDVARLAGVSQSCVSLVLNDAPGARLSDEVRQCVQAAATKIGYRLPDRRARSRVIDKAPPRNTIAFVVDEVSISPHTVQHIDGARDFAWAAGCLVQTYVTRGNQGLELETLANIGRDGRVIGTIYATSFTRKIDLPEALRGGAVVLLNCYTSERVYPTLLPGEVAGGFASTQHLLEQNHRRIGMIGGEAWMSASRDRLRGYREALTTADIGFDPDLVRHGDWSVNSGYACTLELMRLRSPPTAIFCASDLMALGSMGALSELGLSVPNDVSLVGYNDLELSRNLRPPLTSCRLPNYELGQRAVETVLDMGLYGKFHGPAIRKLECQLIIRSSVVARRTVSSLPRKPNEDNASAAKLGRRR
jgi:LacI family transcriptional regulator